MHSLCKCRQSAETETETEKVTLFKREIHKKWNQESVKPIYTNTVKLKFGEYL
jgi:hypothetical protein